MSTLPETPTPTLDTVRQDIAQLREQIEAGEAIQAQNARQITWLRLTLTKLEMIEILLQRREVSR